MTATDTHRVIDAVWRIESARIIAGLTRIVRDVGLAEELAQDALVAALQQWPESGVPDNPGAWLMATAKHRAIDHFRRNTLHDRTHQEIGRERQMQEMAVPDFEAALDDDIGDDLLRLLFISCVDGSLAVNSLCLRRAAGRVTLPLSLRSYFQIAVPQKLLCAWFVAKSDKSSSRTGPVQWCCAAASRDRRRSFR